MCVCAGGGEERDRRVRDKGKRERGFEKGEGGGAGGGRERGVRYLYAKRHCSMSKE